MAASIVCLVLAVMAGACSRQVVTMVDPVFAYLVKNPARALGHDAGRIVVLPDKDTEAAMYAEIDRTEPRILILSPLLASSAPGLLDANPGMIVIVIGGELAGKDSRSRGSTGTGTIVYLRFDPADAARLAADAVAVTLGDDSSGKSGSGADVTTRRGRVIAAVFAPVGTDALSISDAKKAGMAFMEALAGAGVTVQPKAFYPASAWDQPLADELSALDVGYAYVHTPSTEGERWAATITGRNTITYRLSPLGTGTDPGSGITLIRWNIAASIAAALDTVPSTHGQPAAGTTDTSGTGGASGIAATTTTGTQVKPDSSGVRTVEVTGIWELYRGGK